MNEYNFKIVYMNNQTFTNHKETKEFKDHESASEHFYKLLKEFGVNSGNQVPTFSYCKMGLLEAKG